MSNRLNGVTGDSRKRIETAEQDKRLAQIRERHGDCRPSLCDQRWLLDHFTPGHTLMREML